MKTMAPRRQGNGHGLVEPNVFQQQQQHQCLSASNGNPGLLQQQQHQHHLDHQTHHQFDLELGHMLGASLHCCTPGECLRADTPVRTWSLQECVRVVCSNDNCPAGQYMHRECFEAWEQTLLSYLKSCSRARSWSDRQRQQNLWRKGYEIVVKACGCKCGRGHLKKDLDWASPGDNGNAGTGTAGEGKKKKRRNRQNTKPSLTVSSGLNQQQQHQQQHHHHHQQHQMQIKNGQHILDSRARAGSLSSSTGSSSPPATVSETSVSPLHQPQALLKKKNKLEFFGDRISCRQSCGANGIFSRRQDFSAFNALPRSKLNSYHIKMEDEGNHGNDDTRSFILTTLATLHWPKVSCVLCHIEMPVFDRYPLVDGTFFLSPRKHSLTCAEAKTENNKIQYLSAVCMHCLAGNPPVYCVYCHARWMGSSLILGTMYSYDIFAAMPCCADRLKCNSCNRALMYPDQRLNFFSDYSRMFACPSCNAVDTHFVKPLSQTYTTSRMESVFQLYSQWQ